MQQLWIQIYVPLFDNDGTEFSEEPFLNTQEELAEKFGGLSSQESLISGIWRESGHVYHDKLRCLFVLVDNTEANRRFLRDYKETLKKRFRQLEILMLGTPIERF